MPEVLLWVKGTYGEPNVYHLTADGRRTLCFDALVKPKAATTPNPWPTCRACEQAAEKL